MLNLIPSAIEILGELYIDKTVYYFLKILLLLIMKNQQHDKMIILIIVVKATGKFEAVTNICILYMIVYICHYTFF